MLLSEAIILGSLMAPKIRFLRHDAGGTCALGAAEDAIGEKAHWRAHDFFPLLHEQAIHPELKGPMDIGMIVASLNNGELFCYRPYTPWTREAIADWVAGEERKRGLTNEAAAPVEETQCVGMPSSR